MQKERVVVDWNEESNKGYQRNLWAPFAGYEGLVCSE